MTKFNRTSSEPYTIITPLSPLSELEDFLKTNTFALGTVLLILVSLVIKENLQSRTSTVNLYLQLQPHKISRTLSGVGGSSISHEKQEVAHVFTFSYYSNQLAMEIEVFLIINLVATK